MDDLDLYEDLDQFQEQEEKVNTNRLDILTKSAIKKKIIYRNQKNYKMLSVNIKNPLKRYRVWRRKIKY